MVRRSDLARLDRLRDLVSLRQLDCSDTQVADLPLKGLDNLQQLDCRSTKVADLSPLKGLDNLQQLDCRSTKVLDLSPSRSRRPPRSTRSGSPRSRTSPPQGPRNLQKLDCSGTEVADLFPLKGLDNLQQLYCSFTQVADLSPLKGLTTTSSSLTAPSPVRGPLYPSRASTTSSSSTAQTPRSPTSPPARASPTSQQLDCSGTQVAGLSTRLKGLDNLQQLDCRSFCQVADLSTPQGPRHPPAARLLRHPGRGPLPPQGPRQYSSSSKCRSTQVADLSLASRASQPPAARLLRHQGRGPLALQGPRQPPAASTAQAPSLAPLPLKGLDNLQQLDCSRCRLRALPASSGTSPRWRLVLYGSHVPGIPEMSARSVVESCLDAVRAHFRRSGCRGGSLPDVRLLLLGNGRAGKTQIARWLAGEPFDEHGTPPTASR